MRKNTQHGRATQRRSALLALLHKGPQRSDELLAALDREDLFLCDHAADPEVIARQQLYQFRRDLQALRLHYQITFDKRNECYELLETPFGVAFDPKQQAAFALVLHTFQALTIPHADDVQELFAFLLSRLPEEQQQAIIEQRRAITIEILEKNDFSKIDVATLNEIEKAILRGQQLEFTYRSPSKGKDVRHVIEPQPLKQKDGHIYLRGWSIAYQKELPFRLDYVVEGTARMLCTRIAPNRPAPRTYLLRYHLTPSIARNGVSQQFAGQHAEKHPDGSATVTAQVSDLFETRQILLRYGENCTVESPPELLEKLKAAADHFARMYLTPEQ